MISKSTSVKKLEPEVMKFLKATKPIREQAVYWAELREYSEMTWWKRLFKKPPIYKGRV